MQRKNNILNTSYIKHTKRSSRSGIAMIMAIAVIVILATIMALSLALTSQTTKRSTDLYLYEQAVLLSKSATEYALLQISQTSGCLASIPSFTQDDIYDINISIYYIGTAASGCTDYIDNLYTPEQNGSVLMDVTVSVNDPTIASEPIRFFKRTIEKL